MKYPFILAILIFSMTAQAKVEVLFHPTDPTLERIAQWISEADSHVDIAMYNMDVTDSSPVIQALKSPAVRERLLTGRLKMRLIYEGYETPDKNKQRMAELEALGIDARYLGKGVKMHHKLAVIDPAGPRPRVITGSANWSMSSYRNYNENILFFDGEPEANTRFQNEFLRLWSSSKEFGQASVQFPPSGLAPQVSQSDLEIHFNSPRLLRTDGGDGQFLTDQVVRVIDAARSHVDAATTRIRLEPILDAVVRAANRGVKVRIVLSQDDYRDLYKRTQWLVGHPNIQLRVKFYNLKVNAYMTYQMHNKYLIADRSSILTGSFNWSKSGENNHIENLVEMTGPMAQSVLPGYVAEFERLWEMGRTEYPALLQSLAEKKARGEKPKCGFTPMALSYEEIRDLLRGNSRCGADD